MTDRTKKFLADIEAVCKAHGATLTAGHEIARGYDSYGAPLIEVDFEWVKGVPYVTADNATVTSIGD